MPGVDTVAYFNWFGGYYQDPKNNVSSYPIDARRTFDGVPGLEGAEGAARQRWQRTRDGAIVGAALAKQYGWKVGDRVPLRTPIWTKKDGSVDYDFEIVGIYTVADAAATSSSS